VSDPHRFGSVRLIADTCVWSKLKRAPAQLASDFRAAGRHGLIVVSPIVRMEFLHSAPDGAKFDEVDAMFSQLPELPVTREVCEAALGALRDLRETGLPRYWRADLPDVLIAATAACASVNVLSGNRRDFEKLAKVLNFEHVDFPAEGPS
jgi:predicted nucleic acid-binding protein